MRLYAFLLVAAAALHARAATIPIESEKKFIDTIQENADNISENISSEQELLDQANIIKDVENKLRVKPDEVIPVEVIIEDAQLALKTTNEKEDSEEIDRPVPDLKNPGPPQRQEHENQNPEYYASEQQTVLNFKQSINDAQIILSQGFQGITEGIQNMLKNNEPIQTIQQSIQSLREGFTEQINKLNGTIQHYLNSESSSVNEPAVEQTKASFNQIERGLNALRNDFNRGVKNLADGIEVVASLKAEINESNPSSDSTIAPVSSSSTTAPGNPFIQYIESMQTTFSNTLHNFTESINNFAQNQGWSPFSQASTTAAVPAEVQSDSQVPSATPSAPSATNLWQNIQNQVIGILNPQGQNQGQGIIPQAQPGQFGSGSGPLVQAFQNNPFVQNVIQWFQPNRPGAQTSQGTQPIQPAPVAQPAPTAQSSQATSKPSEPVEKPENKPETQADSAQPAAAAQAATVTPAGPIRQILQNNPISQGIAGAVQRLQNINNPEKPRETEKVEEHKTEEEKKADEDKSESESKKGGHGPGSGDINDSSNGSGLKASDAMKENEKVPEVKKPMEEEKEQKTDEVADKTE